MTNYDVAYVRSQFPALKRTIDGRPAAYLDGPGGTQTPQRVLDAVREYLVDHNANYGGRFATSEETDATIAEAHRAGADFLGCDPAEVSFGANMTTLTYFLAEALRDRLVAAGLDIEIVYNRLNRRKVDLIPERPDPPKAQIAELQERVDARLARAGISGVGEVVELSRDLTREAGLAHPGITSDIKHIEIGLTDKSDSMRYVLKALIHDRGRRPQDMIVLGDEFGPIGSSEGSDYLTLIPELRRSTFVSVGVEPNGAPPRVLHVGGGPEEFLRILHDQLACREEVAQQSFPEPTRDPAWRFEVKGFDPFREREVETWLTVANGESGTRGALEEGSAVSTPATFVAGVFGDGTDEPHLRQPVPAPDWTGLRLRAWGSVVNLSDGELLEHERVLDMRHGVVY